MNRQQTDSIRLSGIHISNYKGIDTFNFEFPRPNFNDDPDIIILGGRNGIGKSSFLECCALALLTPTFKMSGSEILWSQLPNKIHPMIRRLPDLLIRSGTGSAEIMAEIEKNNIQTTIHLLIDKTGIFFHENSTDSAESLNQENNDMDNVLNFCNTICRILGYRNDPIIEDWFLHFNSYRNIGFDTPDLKDLGNFQSETESSKISLINQFKVTLLKLLFSNTNFVQTESSNDNNGHSFLEPLEEEISSRALNYFRLVLQQYANGKFLKVKELSDGTYDFLVKIGESEPFSIDGLGSGHKEIISMLLLIWNYSKNSAKVILIDEPELHFNMEWQRKFIQDLFSISNQNQFIFATHSEEVVKSVDLSRCIILKD